MNWNKFFTALFGVTQVVGPLVFHSNRGVVILNSTEEIEQAAIASLPQNAPAQPAEPPTA